MLSCSLLIAVFLEGEITAILIRVAEREIIEVSKRERDEEKEANCAYLSLWWC